jgi:RNA polymerase sigma factor (sigma-70 family)
MPTAQDRGEVEARAAELLAGCAQADARALRELYELVSPLLFGCLLRILRRREVAEEALQDVFVSVWQRAAQYDSTRGRALSWLLSIARYRAIDLLRQERFAPALVADPAALAGASDGTEDPHTFLPAGVLERCLELLSAAQRQCLELAYSAGRSHDEIAQLLGKPLGTVKTWIRRGLLSLKQCLES